MNIFDNIIQSQTNQFTNKVQPQVPTFSTPIAPRSLGYSPPIARQENKVTPTQSKNFGLAPGFEGTVDETKSTLFQAIQGTANGITSIPGILKNNVAEDKKSFDDSMTQKRISFIGEMQNKGYKKEDIFKALDSLDSKGEFDYKPGFLQRLQDNGANRLQGSIDTTTRLSQQQPDMKTAITGTLAYGGDIVGAGTDIIGAGLQPVVEPMLKSVDKLSGGAISSNIKQGSDWYEKFKLENPNLADSVEGISNIVSVLPVPKISNLLKTGAVKTIDTVGQTIKNVPNTAKTVLKTAQESKLGETFLPKKIIIPEGLSKAEQDALKTLSPEHFTPSQLEDLKLKGKVDTGKGISGEKVTYKPDKFDVEIAKNATPYLEKGASTSKNISKLKAAIADEGNALESAIKEQNPIISKNRVTSHFKKALSEMMDHPEMGGENGNIAKRLLSKYQAMLNEEGGTALGILNARKRFDEYIRSIKPKAFDPTKVDIYGNAVKVIRDNANELLDTLVLNKSAKASLKKQSLLYRATEMLAEKKDISTIGKILKNPITKIAGGAALGSAGIGIISNF